MTRIGGGFEAAPERAFHPEAGETAQPPTSGDEQAAVGEPAATPVRADSTAGGRMGVLAGLGRQPDPVPKPLPPELREVQGDLERLQGLIAQARAADGGLDLKALQRLVFATQDADLVAAFRRLEDFFRRRRESTYTSGCGGVRYASGCAANDEDEPGLQLSSDEVQLVLRDLERARAAAPALDANRDGRLSDLEARQGAPAGLAGEFVLAATTSYQNELDAWRDVLGRAQAAIGVRRALDRSIVEAALHHAATPQGQDAIIAAYRDLVTRGGSLSLPQAGRELEQAERNPLVRLIRRLPVFRRHTAGHLSDAEVRRLLGTDDLVRFAAERNAAIEARLGGRYEEQWLQGRDMPGWDQLRDPDYRRGRTLGPDSP
ncbi:MAG: hypothetical protein KatS3mg102_0595 [Planctomycetota bacterium]|nr:MAG: hypothetical protein KatS3mg102_0595 [Planctomycetota bacterium]